MPLTMTRVGCGHLELDALGRLDRHRVRVAERELEVLALERARGSRRPGSRASSAKPVGDALDHVRDERARQPVQGAVLAAVGRARDDELRRRPARRAMSRCMRSDSSPLRAVDADDLGLDRDGHARRDGDGLAADTATWRLPDLRHDLAADASRWRASWPVMTPRDVETIAVPRPPWTFGISRGRRRSGAGRAARRGAGRRSPSGGRRCTSGDADDLARVVRVRRLDVEAVDVALLVEDPRHLALELATTGCRRSRARPGCALRMRVRKSAMGSVIDMRLPAATWSCRG